MWGRTYFLGSLPVGYTFFIAGAAAAVRRGGLSLPARHCRIVPYTMREMPKKPNPSVVWERGMVMVELPVDGKVLQARWKPGVTYVVRGRRIDEDQWSRGVEIPFPGCSFVDLEPDTEYEFSVTAKNSAGESEPALTRTRTNKSGAGKADPSLFPRMEGGNKTNVRTEQRSGDMELTLTASVLPKVQAAAVDAEAKRQGTTIEPLIRALVDRVIRNGDWPEVSNTPAGDK